jgi:hypothetical protein
VFLVFEKRGAKSKKAVQGLPEQLFVVKKA